jgi:T5SS/PEP-CTERM-associated repeat protein/autotransporter-associated beta strand protein
MIYKKKVDSNGSLKTRGSSALFSVLVAIAILSTTTQYAIAQDLYVGSNSSGEVTNFSSGTHSYDNTYIGYDASASSNQITINGVGTLLTNSADLYVGYSGSSNSLTLTDGGSVASTITYIGENASSSNNSVLVTGGGSFISGSSFVGYTGSGNSLIISNVGTVSSAITYIGANETSSNNRVVVTGSGSLWTNSSDLYVGYNGSHNQLVITNGGNMAVLGDIFGMAIGAGSSSSNNSALVTGIESLLTNDRNFNVGYSGSYNSLVISDGATVFSGTDDNNYGSGIGNGTGANGNTALITEAAKWISTDTTGFYIGYGGSSNALVINNAGSLDTMNAYIGDEGGSMNSVLVTGASSLWTNSGYLSVGAKEGAFNTMTVSDGAVVTSGIGIIGASSASSNNSVLVTGLGSWISDTLIVGEEGSGNSLVISGAGTVTSSNASISFGSDASNNSVLVTGAGSLWTISSTLNLGYLGGGSITSANGGTVAAGDLLIAAEEGSSGTLNIGRFGTNDTAGTIITPTIAFGNGTGVINFNQSDSTTVTAAISGAGSVNQLGAGTTTLTGANTYSGTTTVNAGTLLVNNTEGSAVGISVVNVNSGGTLGGNGLIGGATTIESGGNLTPGSSEAGALSFSEGLTLIDGATTSFLINSTNSFTSINIQGGLVSYGGTMLLDLTSYASSAAAGDTFDLFSTWGGGATNTNNFSSLIAIGANMTFNYAGGIWSAADLFTGLNYQFSLSSGQLAVAAVPEPSTYALFGLGALALLMVYRRKSRKIA